MIQSPIWWLFLIGLPPVYWLIPASWRMWCLGLVSLVVLAAFAPGDLLIMLALGGLVYLGFHADGARLPGWAAVAGRSLWPFWLVLGYFVWSKYIPSMARIFGGQGSVLDVAVPLGVSYFSFKLLHYVIEMRRSGFPAHGFDDFVCWLFLAPIFTAGPIERFEHYLSQRTIARFESRFIVEGVLRIGIGLVKKFYLGVIVLATIRQLSGGGLVAMASNLDTVSPGVVWLVLLLTLTYVYLDFSGYTDIAIGSSRLFGLRIMENFNMPFLATSLQKFWQRWHMTLANWCRSYIYMAIIGLTRNPYWAVIATFVVMGLWHSASPHWIAWGLWHGVGLAVLLHWTRFAAKRKIKIFKTLPGQIAGWAATMAYVALGGAFTALYGQAPVTTALRIMAAAFGLQV